jgi:hypothetical protein
VLAGDLELSRKHAFFMIMGGFHYFEGSDKAGDLYEPKHPLTCENVLSMLRRKTLSLPTEEEIQDRSKSDWLAKTIVLLQTLWFVTQCIARSIERLPTTELEVVTLAYTTINVGMFIAWFDKPRNVDRPIRVFQEPVEKDGARSSDWSEKLLAIVTGGQDAHVDLDKSAKVPMFYSGNPDTQEILTADGITLAAGVVFGAIHCIAWSFGFGSHAELLLWRLSSIAITAVSVLLALSIVLGPLIPGEGSLGFIFIGIPIVLIVFSAPLLGLLYVAARLTTLVLAFMNLASLPAGAFHAVHWTTLIPHL